MAVPEPAVDGPGGGQRAELAVPGARHVTPGGLRLGEVALATGEGGDVRAGHGTRPQPDDGRCGVVGRDELAVHGDHVGVRKDADRERPARIRVHGDTLVG